MPLPEGVQLIGDGERGLYVDARCGYSQVFPGRPSLRPCEPRPGEPRADAEVAIADLPLVVRLRLDRMPAGLEARGVAASLCQAFANNRSGAASQVSTASATQLAAWGAAGACSALYPLPGTDEHEEVLVLARPGDGATWAMVITKRFSSSIPRVPQAAFTAAASAELRWRPGEPAPARPPAVWPESTFLEPGVACDLLPQRVEAMEGLAAGLAGAEPAALERVAERLAPLALGASDAPASAVTDEMRATFARYLADVAEPAVVVELFARSLAEVHTAHDLRGLAIWLLKIVLTAASLRGA